MTDDLVKIRFHDFKAKMTDDNAVMKVSTYLMQKDGVLPCFVMGRFLINLIFQASLVSLL